MIRLNKPAIEADDIQAVVDVLETGFLTQGRKVKELEAIVAHYTTAPFAIAVSNGTAALHLSLLAANIRPGDMVLVPAYSFLATANVVELCGAQPVFIDIEDQTFNIDIALLEEEIRRLRASSRSKKLKAVLPVHAFGQPVDMPAMMALAAEHELIIIEDAACALGATINDRAVGSWGHFGCFSFHPLKAITTGEGGMIITPHSQYDRTLRALRNHGQDPHASTPDFILAGYNYRMTDFQAALGLMQMKKLDRIIQSRRQLAYHYDQLLADMPIRLPIRKPGQLTIYQSYVVLLPRESAPQRAAIIAALKEKGIELSFGTYHMPMTRYFRSKYGYKPGDFPVADDVALRALTLPLYYGMQPHEQQYVVACLREQLDRFGHS